MQNRTVISSAVLVLASGQALAGGSLYFDRAQFNADPNTGPTLVEDFDAIPTLTDLTNQTLSGMTLTGANANMPLIVIDGATGVRFPMSPSSGKNVLSPGGSNGGLEEDDLTVTFTAPVQAFGLDVVFDAPDGASFVAVTFRDVTGAVIASNGFIPAPSGAPGYIFVGYSSDSANIASVTFDEFDGSAADDNVAYDTLTVSVPAPGALALLGVGGVALGRRRR
jgi:MYXO-CTERM domain-containing protein